MCADQINQDEDKAFWWFHEVTGIYMGDMGEELGQEEWQPPSIRPCMC